MHVLCALNPGAAGGAALQRWPQVADMLGRIGVTYELLADPARPLEEQLTQRLCEGPKGRYDAIVGVGGDGTHSALINAMMRFRSARPGNEIPPYALVPLGTGNDIAKSFGLTSREDFFVNDLTRAVSTIRYGADYWIDVGVVNGAHFVDAFTIGLDSEILQSRNRHKRRAERIPLLRHIVKGNYLLYAWAMGHHFFRNRTRIVEIHVDGEPWYEGPAVNVIVNNTRIYGGIFDMTPDAHANDGLLDVILFPGHVDYLTRYFLSFSVYPDRVRQMSERLTRASAQRQGRAVEIRAKEPVAAQLDGEELPAAERFSISVIPNAIHIKTPAEP